MEIKKWKMATSFSWTCPYCSQNATITDSNYSASFHGFNENNKDGDLGIATIVTVCPNKKCKEYSIEALLYKAKYDRSIGTHLQPTGIPILTWMLRPQSNAKPFPSYIPAAIRNDYKEACLIRDLSPKASATLSRRCLQGIIRDFWGITKKNLFEEINALKGNIESDTWDAIDAVRSIGNIGAHMEKDINLIIEVEPKEASLLVGLIEIMFRDWYISRHERKQHLKAIVKAAEDKKKVKSKKKP